ncbi:MAG TPA: HAMP domain-containing sensor histidine kinase [Pseudogracilibacillus sp.]|nr:HAMP domain-containing sensor histidine kinase [Pseudogracilibacillus sp.]
MATKSKKFSHSVFTKTIVFLILLASVAGAIYSVKQIFNTTNGMIEIIFEDDFLNSTSFQLENNRTIDQLAQLINEYKSKENILEENTIDKQDLSYRVEGEGWENDDRMDDAAIRERIKDEMIAEDLENFQKILKKLEKIEEPLYYISDGKHTFTNTKQTEIEQFEKYPVHYISKDDDWKVHPSELENNYSFYASTDVAEIITTENVTFLVGYTDNYINNARRNWNTQKSHAMKQSYYLLSSIILFILSFIYLMVTTGRNSFQDKTVHMSPIDKLYVDLNIAFIFLASGTWFVLFSEFMYQMGVINGFIYFITLPYVALMLVLLLSLIRHMKQKTFFKHTVLFIVLHWLFSFMKGIYDSGSTGMKIALIVIFYPIITAASLFFFPLIIGLALWLSHKKVKDFQKIQDGANIMRQGNLQHRINVDSKGEFATLAANINGINEGFKQAVHNELKNERMKTELITNVSHDIRTPLTSLITYTDLLKKETDPQKMQEYIGILDQKSKRLQVLTDDLFAAAKASSGDIPVNIQEIDLVALINQGIGEVSEQISAKELLFKCNYPEEKILVKADGKLLWRSIENILSNIFNYALEGSRVYIDLNYKDEDVVISFKNISKYELNITAEELMERFKRGDDSRSSQGSGLGLSITKSLIENQHGSFEIEIDGDLFKSTISLPSIDKDPINEVS